METNKNMYSTGFRISGDWSIQKKHLKEKYSQLTDEDLKFNSGNENDLINRMEARLHKDRSQVIEIIQQARKSKV